MYRRGCLNRLKELNVHMIWDGYKKDKDFFQYFPDIFLKRNPPREYFWQVLAAVRPTDFETKVGGQVLKIVKAKKIKPDRFNLTDEAQRIFDSLDQSSNLKLMRKLNSKEAGRSSQGLKPDLPRSAQERKRRSY